MCWSPASLMGTTRWQILSPTVSSSIVRLDRLRFEVQGSPRVVVKIKDVNFVQTTFMVGNKSSDFNEMYQEKI